MVGARVQDKVAFGRQAQEMIAEHAIDGFIEAHDTQRGLDDPTFHPELAKRVMPVMRQAERSE